MQILALESSCFSGGRMIVCLLDRSAEKKEGGLFDARFFFFKTKVEVGGRIKGRSGQK